MNQGRQKIRIWAVVPAAGLSRRMGRTKQTLPFANTTVVGAVTRILLEADVDVVIVVTRTDLIDKLKLPDEPRVVIAANDDPKSEMIDSIRIGLAALFDDASERRAQRSQGRQPADKRGTAKFNFAKPSARPVQPIQQSRMITHGHIGPHDGVLVVPGDIPGLSPDTCRRCMELFRQEPQRIVIAAHAGRGGHPIIFPVSMRPIVDTLDGGLNQLSRRYRARVHLVDTTDPAVLNDLDTPDQYDGAVTL